MLWLAGGGGGVLAGTSLPCAAPQVVGLVDKLCYVESTDVPCSRLELRWTKAALAEETKT